jgi:MoxR-like ATPase
VLAAQLPRRLVRLQCYDGMDLASAAYEWDHARQLMAIRLAEAAGDAATGPGWSRASTTGATFSPPPPPGVGGRAGVLLIDELDRADEPFEAFLLEILATSSHHPELGTVRAATPAGGGHHLEPHARGA